MISLYVDFYFNHIKEIIEQVKETQMEKISEAASVMAEAIEHGDSIFVFGASHAGILAEELFYRTGGLALVNPIFNSTILLNTRPVILTSAMERLHGYGKIILEGTPIKQDDVLLIHSVSGRNSVSVEMAIEARKRGIKVIALTNLNYSRNVSSRHGSGKKLYEAADIVIDNNGDFEDSCVEIEGLGQKMAPTSTVIGALIVNSIIIHVVEKLIQKEITPPVFHSANVDGGDAFNKEIFDKYKDRIFYMN
ncbi:MAG: sugar isomerase domain-containing protein [Clostridia bacterium]